MKKKSIKSKINTFSKKLDSLKKKGAHKTGQKARTAFQTLESDLRNTIDLQKEITQLKSALKNKKKDLVTALKKLKNDKSEFKKAKSIVEKIDLRKQRTPRKTREVLPAPIVENVLPLPKKRGRKPKISADKPSQTKVRAARKPVEVKAAVAEAQPKRGRGRARKVAEPVAKVEIKSPAKRGRKKAAEKPAAKSAVKKAPAAKTAKAAKVAKATKPAKTASKPAKAAKAEKPAKTASKPAKAVKTTKPAKAAKATKPVKAEKSSKADKPARKPKAAAPKAAKPGRKPRVKTEKPAEVAPQVTENPAPANSQETPETPVQ
jgi:hypothetical protein